MRDYVVCVCMTLFIACLGLAQQPAENKEAPSAAASEDSVESPLNAMFESKVKAEWEAIKRKDKKAYGDLLADDYQGVEVDGQGERTKIQAINELAASNVYDYTLWGFKFVPLGPDAAFVIYESTIQFPPKSVVRYSRVYITELWIKRKGEWKLFHYQETHVK